MRVGGLAVEPVYDGYGLVDGRKVMRVPGQPDAWDRCGHHLDAGGNIRLTFGGFLLRTSSRTVLIDAGVGPADDRASESGRLPGNLRGLGVTLDDVTDVVFTHLHFDHIGWAAHDGSVMFPNATYRVHQADWDHFSRAETDPGHARKLSPLGGRLETFDAETTLLPGLDARPVPGHTPGSTIYVVSSGDERLLLIGDVMHSPAEVTDPDWEVVWDVDHAAAKKVRAELTRAAADRPDVIGAAHFPFGQVITVDGGHQFRFLR
ncbi:MAG: MBL fold metallo-hydrolase [Streptosporangiales bacterium]|nr:MBL fold metallo-hydrolase [Streptosporangiales bacterium]